MLGQEGVNYHSENFNVTTSKQNNDALVNLSSGSFAGSWGDSTTEYAFLSFFGRGEYNLDGKYYADFSVRADASTKTSFIFPLFISQSLQRLMVYGL